MRKRAALETEFSLATEEQKAAAGTLFSPCKMRAFEAANGTWVEGFLDSKRRGGRHRIVPKESSLVEYAYRLSNIKKETGLELSTASFEEIKEALAKLRKKYTLGGYIHRVTTIKDAMVYLDRWTTKQLAEIVIPKLPDRIEFIRKQVIPDEQLEKLIREAPTARDRVMIRLFEELGGRRGEIANLKVKDVQFDEYGAILLLRGKTGSRRRRMYHATVDLRQYLNEHPRKNDPNSPLLMQLDNTRPLQYNGIYQRVKVLGLSILGVKLRPHQFRHTRATKDARLHPDRVTMALNGWKTHETVAVYVDLEAKDVDDADLIAHGLKTKENGPVEIALPVKCGMCGEHNAAVSVYCSNCGAVLTKEVTKQTIEEEVKRVLKEQGAELLKELAKET